MLSISVKDTDDSLIFTIEDNGIGRTAAKQLSSFKNNGTGIQYINDLIHILNKPNRKKIEIEFEDYAPINNISTRTKITVTIPKNYHYEY